MPLEPSEWNVVVTGAWNLAILTPDGIRRRILEAPDGAAIEVQVPVDSVAPTKTKYGGLSVVPSNARLIVIPDQSTREGIQQAATAGIRAIRSLPVTPLNAAGINLRFRSQELPDPMIDFLGSALDACLADDQKQIVSRLIRRTFRRGQGIVNLQLEELENGSGAVSFNFHRNSTVPEELVAWLNEVNGMVTEATHILQHVMTLIQVE